MKAMLQILVLASLTSCSAIIDVDLAGIKGLFNSGRSLDSDSPVIVAKEAMSSSDALYDEYINNIQVSGDNICQVVSIYIAEISKVDSQISSADALAMKDLFQNMGITYNASASIESPENIEWGCLFDSTQEECDSESMEALSDVMAAINCKAQYDTLDETKLAMLAELGVGGKEEKAFTEGIIVGKSGASASTTYDKKQKVHDIANELKSAQFPGELKTTICQINPEGFSDEEEADIFVEAACAILKMQDSSGKFNLADHVLNIDKNKTNLKETVRFEIIADPENKVIVNLEEINNLVKKQARMELMQIFVNASIAEFSNIFEILSFIGVDVVDGEMSEVGDTLDQFNFDITKLRKFYDEHQFTKVPRSKMITDLLNPNKTKLYMFLDTVIDEFSGIEIVNKHLVDADGQPLPGYYDEFEYFVSAENVCELLVEIDNCSQRIITDLSKFQFIHSLVDKKIKLKYNDTKYFPAPLEIATISYTFDYKFKVATDLVNAKKIAVAFTEYELENKDTYFTSEDSEQRIAEKYEDLEYLKKIQSQGVLSGNFDLEVIDVKQLAHKSILPVMDTTFDSKAYVSIDEHVRIIVPYSSEAPDRDIYLDFGDTSIIEDGDIVLNMSPVQEFITLTHERDVDGTYEDLLGLRSANLSLQFPPYVLNSQDILGLSIALNQGCDEGVMVDGVWVPNPNYNFNTCDYTVKISKDAVTENIDKAFVEVTNRAENDDVLENYFLEVSPFELSALAPREIKNKTDGNGVIIENEFVADRLSFPRVKLTSLEATAVLDRSLASIPEGSSGVSFGAYLNEGTGKLSSTDDGSGIKKNFDAGSAEISVAITKDILFNSRTNEALSPIHKNDLLLTTFADLASSESKGTGKCEKLYVSAPPYKVLEATLLPGEEQLEAGAEVDLNGLFNTAQTHLIKDGFQVLDNECN